MSEKTFRRLEKFDGSGWKEWSCQFKTALRAGSIDAYRLVCEVERYTSAVNVDELELKEDIVDISVARRSAELYDAMTTLLKGEPFTVARGVADLNGLEAWRRIYQKYNPSTPASAMTALMRVMAPGRVKHQRELVTRVEE